MEAHMVRRMDRPAPRACVVRSDKNRPPTSARGLRPACADHPAHEPAAGTLRGDRRLRVILYEAATVILTRSSADGRPADMGPQTPRADRLQTSCCCRSPQTGHDDARDAEGR